MKLNNIYDGENGEPFNKQKLMLRTNEFINS
jgi:hypothetical protein